MPENETTSRYWDPTDAPEGEHIFTYAGIRMFAQEKVHAACIDWLTESIPAGGRVLDMAAGPGALASRLRDAGFAVTANDLYPDQFQPKEIPCLRVDLNGPFDRESFGGEFFDAVAAVELIEHLENPSEFLRRCHGLLRPGGVLFLSTPDVGSLDARFQFLRYGHPPMFGAGPAEEFGHITPLPEPTLRFLFAKTGWKSQRHISVGSRRIRGVLPRLRAFLRGVIVHALRILMGNRPTRGEAAAYLLVAKEDAEGDAVRGRP